jgi:hypothetical protein
MLELSNSTLTKPSAALIIIESIASVGIFDIEEQAIMLRVVLSNGTLSFSVTP